jgi:hypothetical protein
VTVIVTGVAELDAALLRFEDKVQKKWIRQSLRRSIKIVKKDFDERCPIGVDEDGNDTGVMQEAATIRVPKGKKRWEQKIAIIIDKVKLMTLYFQKYGRFPGKRKGDSEPFFYPAVVELGDANGNAKRPMRSALYGNEQQVKEEFINQLSEAVATAGK